MGRNRRTSVSRLPTFVHVYMPFVCIFESLRDSMDIDPSPTSSCGAPLPSPPSQYPSMCTLSSSLYVFLPRATNLSMRMTPAPRIATTLSRPSTGMSESAGAGLGAAANASARLANGTAACSLACSAASAHWSELTTATIGKAAGPFPLAAPPLMRLKSATAAFIAAVLRSSTPAVPGGDGAAAVGAVDHTSRIRAAAALSTAPAGVQRFTMTSWYIFCCALFCLSRTRARASNGSDVTQWQPS
mmetsp:Transcript_2979/g.10665  ORF Transcript_2979/g.10665 Transcript_2979/m.10665 type:complete len:244 (-) Transcript_2979:453-1184(-)